LNIKFIETSAKNSTNVEDTFLTLAQQIKQKIIVDGPTSTPTPGQSLTPLNKQEPTEKKAGCC